MHPYLIRHIRSLQLNWDIFLSWRWVPVCPLSNSQDGPQNETHSLGYRLPHDGLPVVLRFRLLKIVQFIVTIESSRSKLGFINCHIDELQLVVFNKFWKSFLCDHSVPQHRNVSNVLFCNNKHLLVETGCNLNLHYLIQVVDAKSILFHSILDTIKLTTKRLHYVHCLSRWRIHGRSPKGKLFGVN